MPDWIEEVRMVMACPGRMSLTEPVAAALFERQLPGLCNFDSSPSREQ
jgi:hypothetical protein